MGTPVGRSVQITVITPIGTANKVREISVARHYDGAFGLSMTHRVDTQAEANDYHPGVGLANKSTVYMTADQRRALAAALLEGLGTACQVPASHHSRDLVQVFHGEAEPIPMCGFHASDTVTSFKRIREASNG